MTQGLTDVEWRAFFAAFIEQARARLEQGARDFPGNPMFDTSHVQLIEEQQQEVLDDTLYGFGRWVRLERRKATARVLDGQAQTNGQAERNDSPEQASG